MIETPLHLDEANELLAAWAQRLAAARGIRLLAIKCRALSDDGLRPPRVSADVDILLDPARFDDFCDAALAAGWEEFPSTFASTHFTLHSRSFRREGWPNSLDVHSEYPGMLRPPTEVFDALWAGRRIREISDTHILLITALTDEADAVMGFAAGADDVITKPFRARELRARIIAAQRRRTATVAQATGSVPVAASAPAGTLSGNGLQLNRATRAALLNGEALTLTRTEFELLAALLEAAPTVLSKSDLVRVLHDEPGDRRFGVTDAEERAIETHMGNFRRKLGDSAAEPRFIETLRAVGYRAVTSTRQSGG